MGALVGGGIHRHPVSVHLLWTERTGWSAARMAAGQGFQVTILRFSPFSFPFSSSLPPFFLPFLSSILSFFGSVFWFLFLCMFVGVCVCVSCYVFLLISLLLKLISL